MFPLFAQIEAEKNVEQQMGVFHLVGHADPVVKLALFILLIFSVGSWAIIFYKSRQIKQAQKEAQNFWALFSKAKGFQEILDNHVGLSGPLYVLFATGLEVGAKIKKGTLSSTAKVELLRQKLIQSREEEIYKLEQYIPFLATTASTAPFVGLFGTVWGILTAFWAIGKAGSSSLATVGPFISEALIATAIGLAAAIPAVVAYNFFISKIKLITKMIDLFLEELMIKSGEEL
jgi:biopolymer transport protein TolQ